MTKFDYLARECNQLKARLIRSLCKNVTNKAEKKEIEDSVNAMSVNEVRKELRALA